MITSTGNAQLKHLQQLLKKASLRRKEGVYVVEGWRSFREVPADLLQEVYLAESQEKERKSIRVPVQLVADRVMESVSDTQTCQGIIAIVRMKEQKKPNFAAGGFFLLCEHLQDPGNLGTIVRMAEASGVTALVLSSDTVDLYNPKVVRATMGAILRVPVWTAEDLITAVQEMKQAGVAVYGAALEDSVDYATLDYSRPTAFIIGNEANGMTEALKKVCSGLVHIPMEGQVESLNAAVAASVLSFEAYRQRRLKK